MLKDIVTCENCKYFCITPNGISLCNNSSGLPFPTYVDYCSQAEESDVEISIDRGMFLKLVREQRFS